MNASASKAEHDAFRTGHLLERAVLFATETSLDFARAEYETPL
jgi:hypothetical protein